MNPLGICLPAYLELDVLICHLLTVQLCVYRERKAHAGFTQEILLPRDDVLRLQSGEFVLAHFQLAWIGEFFCCGLEVLNRGLVLTEITAI